MFKCSDGNKVVHRYWRAKKDVCPSTIEIKLSSQYIFVKMRWILLTSLVRSTTCLAPNTINDIREHNVVHYGEVLLLQDYQLDNGSRLEKFRGKEGQTVHWVFHLGKNRSSFISYNWVRNEPPCICEKGTQIKSHCIKNELNDNCRTSYSTFNAIYGGIDTIAFLAHTSNQGIVLVCSELPII